MGIWDEMNDLRRRMDEFMTDSFSRDLVPASFRTPVADVYETESEVCVDLEMPGVDKKDIDIEVLDRSLRVKVERDSAIESEDEGVYRSERSYAGFYRTIPMPDSADLDRVKAHYENGVLEIRVPKRENAKGRRVKVA